MLNLKIHFGPKAKQKPGGYFNKRRELTRILVVQNEDGQNAYAARARGLLQRIKFLTKTC